MLSDYDPDSELSRLSRSAPAEKGVPVSEPCGSCWPARSLGRADRAAPSTSPSAPTCVCGAAPGEQGNALARTTGRSPRGGRLSISEARRAAPHGPTCCEPNMRLDLGGIAMGYAVDETLKLLRAAGHHAGAGRRQRRHRRGRSAAGQAGLDDRRRAALGRRHADAGRSCWPTPPSRPPATPFNTSCIDGKRYSHIVDPHTGLG